MKKNLILPILAFFAFADCYAQKNLQPAYIVDNNNDTVHGYINYKEWFRNPNSIFFATLKETAPKKFTIQDIESFGIPGKELYRRFTVSISINKNIIDESALKDTVSKTGSVFLKVLYDGKLLQLFSYNDEMKSRLYVLSAGNTIPAELRNTEYMTDGQIKSEKEFHGVLSELAKKYAPGNTELQSKISSAGFYKDEIFRIVSAMDGNSGIKNDDQPVTKERAKVLRFFAGAGVSAGTIKIIGDNRFAGKTGGMELSPLIGAGFDVLFNPYIGRLFLRTDISYSTASTTAHAYEEYFASKEYYDLVIKQNTLSVAELINYNLYNGKYVKYFIGAGPGFNFSSYPKNEQTHKRVVSGDTTVINDNYFDFIKKFWMNGIVRTGVSVKNINIALAYTAKANFTNYAAYGAYISSFRFQVNYNF